MHSLPSHLPGRRRFLALGAAAALLPRIPALAARQASMVECLRPGVWEKVQTTIDEALAGLDMYRGFNGEIGPNEYHPASTSMCVMAFLSRGHTPGHGKYGELLEKAVDSVLASQAEDGTIGGSAGQPLTYTHAISGLMLGEVYGRTRQGQSLRIREAIIKALAVTRKAQTSRKMTASHKGGVRYFSNLTDSDLSVTGWHFMFYRSAKNAEFDVPEAWVIEMLQFVNACKNGDGFGYQPGHPPSLAMTSVGLLCMTMAGKNDHPLAVATAIGILKQDLSRAVGRRAYSLYYASLAMAQMGGEYWRRFFPDLVENQLADPRQVDGLWERRDMGAVLDTAFRVLSLTPPYQLLPIFQR